MLRTSEFMCMCLCIHKLNIRDYYTESIEQKKKSLNKWNRLEYVASNTNKTFQFEMFFAYTQTLSFAFLKLPKPPQCSIHISPYIYSTLSLFRLYMDMFAHTHTNKQYIHSSDHDSNSLHIISSFSWLYYVNCAAWQDREHACNRQVFKTKVASPNWVRGRRVAPMYLDLYYIMLWWLLNCFVIKLVGQHFMLASSRQDGMEHNTLPNNDYSHSNQHTEQ